MDTNKIEEAYNDTFSGLTMYYRDCDLKQEYILRYSVGQILMERGFTDVSSYAEGLDKNLRYAIASNKAVYMGQINPEVAKFGFNLISAPSYYKILDIYTIGDQTQILLLNVDEKYIDIFKSTQTNIEEKVIGMGRASLDKKIKMEPSNILYEKFWIDRTQFPLGMSDNGVFFLPNVEGKQSIIKEMKLENESSEKTDTNELKAVDSKNDKKGFWKRIFQ